MSTTAPFPSRAAAAVLAAALYHAAPLARAAAQPSVPATDTSTLGRAQRMLAANRFDSAAALLDALVAADERNAQAWLALGAARRGLGRVDDAAAALRRAESIPATTTPARRALFLLHADAGRLDDAYRSFDALRRAGGTDLTLLAGSREVASLRGEARFAELFPSPDAFAHPFVEPEARIVHEWRGEAPGDEFGWIARPIGDVNGDGVPEVAISAPANPPYGAGRGKVYLYDGRSGARRWRREGDAGALLGLGLEAAGDVDGDGAPDVVVGAPGIAAALVYSGRDGRELLRLRGDSVARRFGTAVAGVGDVDGDGRPDLLVGASASGARAPGAGRAYLFSGRDGHVIAALDGEHPGDAFGATVGGGDGWVIVGASGAGAGGRGRVYVYRGLAARPAFVKDADSTGVALGAMFVSVVGDVDADGTADVYAADFPNAAWGPSTGRAYVYSGATGATLLTLTGETAGEGYGIGAARLGDVDGDGRADLVVGSWQYRGAAWSGGRVLVQSGRDGRVLRSLTGRVPGETLGFDAVGAGDADGDGLVDLLVTSAWSMVNGVRSGRAYVVAGVRPPRP